MSWNVDTQMTVGPQGCRADILLTCPGGVQIVLAPELLANFNPVGGESVALRVQTVRVDMPVRIAERLSAAAKLAIEYNAMQDLVSDPAPMLLTLREHGIKGEIAAIKLRRVLLALVRQPEQVVVAGRRMRVRNSAGEMWPLEKLLADFVQIRDLSQPQAFVESMVDLFGEGEAVLLMTLMGGVHADSN
jgi:hypothetical protein